MAEAISPGIGRRYGVERICRVWDVARSTFYAIPAVGQQDQACGTKAAKRRFSKLSDRKR